MTTPSPFLSMFLKSFSMVLSCWFHIIGRGKRRKATSPMNSSKLSRPSKSRSIEPKKSSTSSLNFQTFLCQTIFHFSHLVVGTPLELRTLNHSWSGKCNYVLVLIRKQACKPWRWACIQSKLSPTDFTGQGAMISLIWFWSRILNFMCWSLENTLSVRIW